MFSTDPQSRFFFFSALELVLSGNLRVGTLPLYNKKEGLEILIQGLSSAKYGRVLCKYETAGYVRYYNEVSLF